MTISAPAHNDSNNSNEYYSRPPNQTYKRLLFKVRDCDLNTVGYICGVVFAGNKSTQELDSQTEKCIKKSRHIFLDIVSDRSDNIFNASSFATDFPPLLTQVAEKVKECFIKHTIELLGIDDSKLVESDFSKFSTNEFCIKYIGKICDLYMKHYAPKYNDLTSNALKLAKIMKKKMSTVQIHQLDSNKGICRAQAAAYHLFCKSLNKDADLMYTISLLLQNSLSCWYSGDLNNANKFLDDDIKLGEGIHKSIFSERSFKIADTLNNISNPSNRFFCAVGMGFLGYDETGIIPTLAKKGYSIEQLPTD